MTVPTVGVYAVPDPTGNPPLEVHDHALAMMCSGRLLHHVELERVSRIKHDNRLPDFLEQWLSEGLLDLPDSFRLVAVDNCEGGSFASRSGRIAAWPAKSEHLSPCPQKAYGNFLGCDVEFWSCSHELAHVCSHLPFVGQFEENSLLVHVDGGASRSNASVWRFREGRLSHLHHSWELKPVVSHFFDEPLSYAILNMPREDELALAGKLMGYAAYGSYDPELLDWLIRNNWFRACEDDWSPFFRAMRDLDAQGSQYVLLDGFRTHQQLLKDIAACMQRDLEDRVIEFITRFQRATGARHLYFSGGTALNIHLNDRIERTMGFDSVHVPPCCSDSGLALGAAALPEFLALGRVDTCGPFVNDLGAPKQFGVSPTVAAEVADRLARGQVVGILDGPAEIGPRALGARSLLAHPGSLALRDRLSRQMKQREWYRPVAPIVLLDQAPSLFEDIAGSRLSRYMLRSFTVRPEQVPRVPGIVHVDGTARAQVVDPSDPGFETVARVLLAVRERHGIPCLINTSFNQRGEPLVHNREQALSTASKLGVDTVLVEGQLIACSPPREEVPGEIWSHETMGVSR